MSEKTENVLDKASESLEQARQLPSIDPTLGRMMDSFDNAVNILRESQREQLDAQKELGRKQIEMAERKAAVIEKLSSAGMKFAFCFLAIGAIIVGISMFTGHFEQVLAIGEKLGLGLLILVTTILGYDKIKATSN